MINALTYMACAMCASVIMPYFLQWIVTAMAYNMGIS